MVSRHKHTYINLSSPRASERPLRAIVSATTASRSISLDGTSPNNTAILRYESRNIDDTGRRIEDNYKAKVLNMQWFPLRPTHLCPEWSSGKFCAPPPRNLSRWCTEFEIVLGSIFLQKYGYLASQITSSSLRDFLEMQRCSAQPRRVQKPAKQRNFFNKLPKRVQTCMDRL